MNKNKQYYLIITFESFKSKLEELISEAGNIHEKAVNTEEELDTFKTIIKDWERRATDLLESSFNEPRNSYEHDFRYANPSFYHISGVRETLKQLVDKQKQTIATKQKSLWDNLRIVGVSDVVISPDKIDKNQRERYTVDEKLELLLNKLYDLYDNFYYPVREILEGNGIILRRHDEDRELASILENSGYVRVLGISNGISAQLTAEGAMLVENGRKSVKEIYDDIHQTPEELEQKINEINERLIKLGYGQEIIFDELQELKELYTKLNKKTWGQLLKGKIMDIAMERVIDMDTLKGIYETLTQHKLHLP